MKSSKKLYKKKMQPPKYAIGAVLAPLAAAVTTSGVPAAGAAATGAAATSAAATGAISTGALSASTSGTIAGATGTSSGASASTSLPFGMLKSNANPNTMQGFNSMLGIDPTKAAGAGQMTQSKNASSKVNDIMQLDSIGDLMSLNKLPMLAISGIRENALRRQKGKMNQMNFADNMNTNMDSGAYGDSGMMKKGGIMNSVAELTGQEYIVPKELIPYALAAGNAKPYASDKTDGAYSHETNPIQVYRAGGDMYVDEQGNTMQAGDLIIPEHKANSRAGIMSAMNQNPYNNRAFLGKIINPDAYKDQKGLDKYDAMASMAAYTLGANSLNRLRPAEQVRNVELVNPREAQFNPYFMQRQAKDMANQYYNTSQYTKSGSLSDNMATATNAQQMANEILTKSGATVAEAQQAADFKNAELYNAALAQNAESINKTNMYNADLLQKSNAMKTEANYRNMQDLNKSIIGIQELSNMSKSQSIQEDVIKYQLELQKMQAQDDAELRDYQIKYEKYLNDIKTDPSVSPPAIPSKRNYPPFTINLPK